MEKRSRRKQSEQQAYFKSLKEGLNVEDLLKHYKVRNLYKNGRYLNGSCPLPSHGGPDNEPSFGMISEPGSSWNGWFKCYKCGKGSVADFIITMEKCTFNDVLSFLKDFSSGGEIYSERNLDREFEDLDENKKEEEQELEEENDFIPQMWRDDLLIAKYLITDNQRNFSSAKVFDIIREYSIGMARFRGKKRIIVPIKDERGNWKTFFAQNYRDNSDKKFPKGSKIGNYLFGLDRVIDKTRKVFIAEGIWDALRIRDFGDKAVSSFSTSLSERQAELITENFDSVIFAYDNDTGGEKGYRRAIEMLFPEVAVYRVEMPVGADPCLCTLQEWKNAKTGIKRVDFEAFSACSGSG